MSDNRASDSLLRGIETAKAGNKLLARLHLLQAVELAPRDPNCWLWLAWVSESPASAIHSLEKVLEEDPNHELAQIGMHWALGMADYEYQDYSNKIQVAAPREERETRAEEPAEEPAQSRFEEAGEVSGEPEAAAADEPAEDDFFPSDDAPTFSGNGAVRESESLESRDAEFPQDDPSPGEDAFQEPSEDETAEWAESDTPKLLASAETEDAPAEQNHFEATSEDAGFEEDTRFADENEQSVESNASDETLTESSWWRNNPAAEAVPEEPQPSAAPSESSWGESAAPEAPEPIAESNQNFEASNNSAPIFEVEEPEIEVEPQEVAAADPDTFEPVADEADSDFGVSVLVVDDSPTVRKLVTMTLEKNGFTVGSAPDGVVALKSIAELKPRLILLDITMPRLGGYQLCKLIKKHESTKHIPVIMLSGKDGMFDKVRGKFVGCDDYITKPFDPDVLVEKITTQLTERYGVAAT